MEQYYTKIADNITNNIANRKLHHGLIFLGTKGIGKADFIKNLAQKLTNSTSELTNNPDILLIEKSLNQKKQFKQNITIDEVRMINDFINLTSSKSQYRFIIIDAIDDLNKNAANAILKNLEEPKDNIFFFLISHNENQILNTIKSRCNIIKIKNPDYKYFHKIISTNSLNISDKEIETLFLISTGSIGLALQAYQNNAIEIYQNFLGMATGSNQEVNTIELSNDLIKKDPDLKLTCQIITLIFNRIVKKSQNIFKNELFDAEEFIISQYLQKHNLDNIFKIYGKISDILIKTSNLNLDKKHSLINIINLIKNA